MTESTNAQLCINAGLRTWLWIYYSCSERTYRPIRNAF